MSGGKTKKITKTLNRIHHRVSMNSQTPRIISIR